MAILFFIPGTSNVNATLQERTNERTGRKRSAQYLQDEESVMEESVQSLKSDLADVQQRLTQVEAEKQSSAIHQISCGNKMIK